MSAPSARQVWFDGRLVAADAPHLSVYDRGFQLGDGVFEALRARRGVAIELRGHLARLHDSLDSLAMTLPFSDAEIADGIAELLAAEGFDATGLAAVDGSERAPGDAVVRLTVSRGFDPTRDVRPAAGGRCSVAIQVWPFVPPAARVLDEGERLVTSAIRRDPSSPMAGIKTTSRAELVYARLEAQKAGADDALFLTTDGRVAEATTANVLVIRGADCATPRLGCGLLPGTTRAWLMAHGGATGLRMTERDVSADELLGADELAVCASIGGVTPVTELDGRRIGDGRPGPRTMALREARERWMDDHALEVVRARASGASASGASASGASASGASASGGGTGERS